MFTQRRRIFFISLLILLAVAMVTAACGSTPASEPAKEEAPAEEAKTEAKEAAPAEEAASEEMSTELEEEVEIFTWWTSGGEAAAVQQAFDTFNKYYPDTEIINATVAGGTGTNARAVLATRLSGGDVPDSWQALGGVGFKAQYIDTEYAAPLQELFEEEGWFDVYPQLLLDMVSDENGVPYMVPVNIHRANELWYNKAVVADAGIEIGDTMSMDQFFEYAETIQAAGVDPLCVGDSGVWTQAHLFESVLVGKLGADGWNGLWDGSTSFDDPKVKEAMETYSQMLNYINSDHSALSWDQAVKKVIEGKCAFTVMGDWSYGEFVNAGMTDNVEFGWVSVPGTDNIFVGLSDGFTLGAGSPPHPKAATEWLRVAGGKEAQEKLNPLKGSICARTDCDPAVFGEYLQWALNNSQTGEMVGSMVHGAAAPPDFQQAFTDAITLFLVDNDVEAFSNALVQAAADSGFGQ
jgi:glucose/mannose transport system substrate-binding protein